MDKPDGQVCGHKNICSFSRYQH